MSYGPQTGRYLEADIMSRPKEWLVPLLYEHLLSSLRRAAVQMEMGDVEGKAASLTRANDIVLELAGTLDHEKGGEIAGHLGMLYGFFATTIMDVGRTMDRATVERLVAMAAELHEAWVGAAEAVAPRGRRSPDHAAVAV